MGNPRSNIFFCFLEDKYTYKQRAGVKKKEFFKLMCENFSLGTYENFQRLQVKQLKKYKLFLGSQNFQSPRLCCSFLAAQDNHFTEPDFEIL